MAYFELSDQERRSFLGANPRFVSIDGPLSLVRFVSSERARKGMSGRYWMYGTEVAEILQMGLPVIREISERWAICDDWGDCSRAAVLHIPAQSHVDAWFGFAKFQPKISVAGQKASGRKVTNSYAGGSIQLILKVTDRERNWMKGPYFPQQMSRRHLGAVS